MFISFTTLYNFFYYFYVLIIMYKLAQLQIKKNKDCTIIQKGKHSECA